MKIAFTLLALTTSTAAFAQGPSDTLSPPAAQAALPSVAVTFSPIHLVIPFLEVTAEVRLAPKVGVGVTGGAGVTHINEDTTNDKVTLLEGGISPRYYLTGDFRGGVQLGAEVQYLYASANDSSMSTVSAAGLSMGPYVGYKWTAAMGLTLEAQGGVSFLAIKGSDSNSDKSEKHVFPLLNLNAGWSF
jgi:hypothetical protein